MCSPDCRFGGERTFFVPLDSRALRDNLSTAFLRELIGAFLFRSTTFPFRPGFAGRVRISLPGSFFSPSSSPPLARRRSSSFPLSRFRLFVTSPSLRTSFISNLPFADSSSPGTFHPFGRFEPLFWAFFFPSPADYTNRLFCHRPTAHPNGFRSFLPLLSRSTSPSPKQGLKGTRFRRVSWCFCPGLPGLRSGLLFFEEFFLLLSPLRPSSNFVRSNACHCSPPPADIVRHLPGASHMSHPLHAYFPDRMTPSMLADPRPSSSPRDSLECFPPPPFLLVPSPPPPSIPPPPPRRRGGRTPASESPISLVQVPLDASPTL